MKDSESRILSVTTSLVFTCSWLSFCSFLNRVSVRGGNMALGHSTPGVERSWRKSESTLPIYLHWPPCLPVNMYILPLMCMDVCVCVVVVVVVSCPKAFLERVME